MPINNNQTETVNPRERAYEAGTAYTVSSPLVHWAIISILTAIVFCGMYMVIWALGDSGWKATVIERLITIEGNTKRGEAHIRDGHPQRIVDQIDETRRRIRKLEEHVEDAGH